MLLNKLKKSLETVQLNDVLSGRYAILEKYKLKEFFSLGFPEMYLLASNPVYEVVGSRINEVSQKIINECDKKDYFISGVRVYLRNKEVIKKMFPNEDFETHNYFETLVKMISTFYTDTERESLAGVAYHVYVNIRDEKLDRDVLMYMLEVLNKNTNLWKSDHILNVHVNRVQTLYDILKESSKEPMIERVAVENETGDLLDVKTNVANRVDELSRCLTYIINLELRRKEKTKTKEELKTLRTEAGESKDWIQSNMLSMASFIDVIVKEIKNAFNPDTLREIDYLEKYRGVHDPLDKTGQKMAVISDLMIMKRKLDSEMFVTDTASANENKYSNNMERLKVKFENELELESLKLDYINALIEEGFKSRMSYFENMM